jgi:hypothetical protein
MRREMWAQPIFVCSGSRAQGRACFTLNSLAVSSVCAVQLWLFLLFGRQEVSELLVLQGTRHVFLFLRFRAAHSSVLQPCIFHCEPVVSIFRTAEFQVCVILCFLDARVRKIPCLHPCFPVCTHALLSFVRWCSNLFLRFFQAFFLDLMDQQRIKLRKFPGFNFESFRLACRYQQCIVCAGYRTRALHMCWLFVRLWSAGLILSFPQSSSTRSLRWEQGKT